LQEQGDETGALEVLEGLLKKDGDNAELIRRVVGLQLRNERVADAIPLLKKLLEIEKGGESEHAAVARLMIESEQVEAANSFLEEAAKKFPDSAEFPYLLTFSLARAERWPSSSTKPSTSAMPPPTSGPGSSTKPSPFSARLST
jgi:predicted Zn-dependent protease